MSHRTGISVSEALEAVLARAPAPVAEDVPVDDALGRTLAAAVRARADHPNVANSALDGYACRAPDTAGASDASPVRLRVVGEVPAGRTFPHAIGPQEAVSIYTGGAVPTGADAIVPVEATARDGDVVLVRRPASRDDIRPRAQDIAEGEVGLEPGRRLDAAALALAAGMGHASVPVTRSPRVGVLATGSELVAPGGSLAPGQVFDANATGIAALIRAAGGEPRMLPRVTDDMQALRGALSGQPDLDLLVTSGGVSMGRYDLVRDLLFEHGSVDFWKVLMRPGGPVLFGTLDGVPLLGLPGNPVSSLVAGVLYATAFVERGLGRSGPPAYRRRTVAVADETLSASGPKETFLRVRLEARDHETRAARTGSQSSGVLRSMAVADALAVVPPGSEIAAGGAVEVIPLRPILR